MKLDTPFYRLPIRFDAAELAREAGQFAEREWRPHPQGYAGNSAIPLLAANGDPADDGVRGPMRPTPALGRCPYIRQVLASLGTVLGRTRLMRIVGHGEATPHVDTNYYWMHHVRVHVPAVTTPGVQFVCDGEAVHMKAGECWVFDTWRLHNVINPADASRIHLVADTVGTAAFWDLLDVSERPFDPGPGQVRPDVTVPFDPAKDVELECEGFNFPVVMTPWEQECMIAELLEPLVGQGDASELQSLLVRVNRQWRALWARFADRPEGFAHFKVILGGLEKELAAWQGRLKLPNGIDLVEALMQAVVRPALNADLCHAGACVSPAPKAATGASPVATRFERPVILVAAPRSGSTLLFETLARSPDLFTVGGESHEQIESVAALHPSARSFDSNRLTREDATPEVIAAVRQNFLAALRDRDGKPPTAGASVRLLEKTPKNALRIDFLDAVFPDALFVYLRRDPRDNISSIIDAWRSGRFVTYPSLPGWRGAAWSLLLTPGWRDLIGEPLEVVAARQWRAAHEHIMAELGRLPRRRWTCVSHEELLAQPQATVRRLAAFAGVAWDDPLDGPLPHSRHTLTPPDKEKWRKNAAELARVLPGVEGTAGEVRAFAAPAKASPKDEPLRSVSTNNFAALLASLNVSLAVSTYQAGKLILLRADGDKLNTHFRAMQMPMGLALRGNRLAVGAGMQVWQFQNQPEAARLLEPADKHDACFVPRQCHWTGDIRVHEIAFTGDGQLWVVNTRFSCLCTLDGEHSFVPRWRPAFVTALAPEDRCHLNGLAMRDGVPRYVTCLGATDAAGGWRDNKRNGGLLLDVTSGEVMLTGLSMPHSPRWHQERLWLLESGEGGIGHVEGGAYRTLARLPGFTRGIDFVGHLAFVGLSQVRETAVFSGLPLTDRLGESERCCGVWVVDLRDGKTVAFLRFEGGVQEIFAVQVLPGVRFPELLTDDEKVLSSSFVLPDAALADLARPA